MNQKMSWFRGVIRSVNKAWGLIAAPSSEVRDPGKRRQAELLAGLSILLSIAAVGGMIGSISASGGQLSSSFFVQLPLVFSSLLTYGFSRSRYYRLGAWILALTIASLGFIDAAVSEKPVEAALIFITIAYLMILGIFSWVEIVVFTVILMAACFELSAVSPEISMAAVGTIFGQVLTYGLLAIGVNATRNAVERDRVAEVVKTSEQLQQLSESLEQRVAERTRDITLAAEIGRRITMVRDLNSLLSQAVELIRERFNLYYTQVYLADARGQNLAVRAGTGRIGEEMLRRGHRLTIDLTSLNGSAALERRAVIVEDTAHSLIFKPHPLLPDTRSEIAVPLIAGDRVLGVLDLQSSVAGALTSEVLPAFETLAGMLATALLNAELFDQAQRSLAEMEARSRQSARQNWDAYLNAIDQKERLAYVFEGGATAPLEAPLVEDHDPRRLNASINVTGEPVGMLQLESDAPWNSDAVELVNVITAQLAQQVENLRLLDQAERYRHEMETALRRATREEWQAYTGGTESSSLAFQYAGDEVTELENGANAASGVTVAIKVQDEMIGQVGLRDVQELKEDDQELVRVICEQLSAHLENIRLFDAAQREIAERSRTEQALDSQRRTLQAVLDNMPTGVLMVEAPSGRPILSNRAAEELLGRGISPNAAGDDLNDVYQAYKLGTDQLYPASEMPVVAGMTGKPLMINDMELRKPDGSRTLLQVNGAPVYDASGKIVASVAVFQDITEQHQQEEMIARRASELATVSQMATTITTILSPDSMLQTVVDLTKASFNLYHAHIYLLNDAGDTLVLAKGAGEVGRQMVAEGRQISLHAEKSLVARAARLKEGIIVNDVRQDPEFLPHPLLPETRSEMAVPMMSGDQLLGVLDVQASATNRFTEEDIMIQSTLSAQVSIALQNARQYEQTQEILADTEALYNVTSRLARSRNHKEVLDAVVEGTVLRSFESASVYYFDRPWSDQSKPGLVLTEAVWEQVPGSFPMNVGQPLPIQALPGLENLLQSPYSFVDDARTYPDLHDMVREMLVQAGMISSLNVRLLVGGEWVGCISATASQPKTLTEQDIRRLLILVDQATAVLYGLFQYQSTQARARREQTLREITARVRSSMDPEAILRTAVRELGNALGRQTFVRLGSSEQLLEKPAPGNGHAADGKNGSASLTGEGGM